MYPQIQLSDARAKREEYRALLAKGIDPQEEKTASNKNMKTV